MISPETVALVRERADIVAVVSESVPSLKRRGRSFVGLCPFHKEKSPSFHVNQDRGFFHCFGCKESGSAIDFIMKQDGATFPEAVRGLAERFGIPIMETERVDRGDVDRQKRQREDLYAVSQLAATFYEEQLRKHLHREHAHAELARRGLQVEDDVVQAFRIGYAPASWDGLTSFLRAQGVSPILAESVGLLVPRSSGQGHYDRFRHRLMFAVMDTQGRVVAFSGRSLATWPADAGQPPPEPPAKYINSPESPIYTKGHLLFGLYQARHAIRSEGRAVLVEGNFDVASLHARGIGNVVAPLGTAFTLDQAKLLKRFATEVVLCFDGDTAGKKATTASRGPLADAGLTAKVATLPPGTDPDDYARNKGADALRDVLARAKGMLEHLIDQALDESFSAADAFERAQRVTQVSQLLASENDPLVRSMAKAYADDLAGRLDMQRSPDAFRALEQTVRRALAQAEREQKALPPGVTQLDPRRARVAPKPAGSPERREIIAALIEFPELIVDVEIEETLNLLEGPSVLVISALRKALQPTGQIVDVGEGTREQEHPAPSRKALDIPEFLAQIPASVAGFARERLADPVFSSREEAKAHLIDNGKKLKRLILSREAVELAREQTRVAGDWETETELAKEAEERVRMKHGLGKQVKS